MQKFQTKSAEGKALLIHYDAAFADSAPDPIYPWLLWVFVKLHHADNDGLWSEPEAHRIYELHEELLTHLGTLDLLHVGFVVQEGWVEFYFYATQGKRFANKVAEALGTTGYMYETGSRRDSKWEHYRFNLLPDPLMQLHLQSEATQSALLEEGDDLNQAREVEHYLLFQTASQRERTLETLMAQGFTCKECFEHDDATFAYGAILIKAHSVTKEAIEPIVAYLHESAQDAHGSYEGWSTILATK